MCALVIVVVLLNSTLTTHPLHSKLCPLEVHDADGPIATFSNTPLHSLSGGEGQEGPHLKGSNALYTVDSE